MSFTKKYGCKKLVYYEEYQTAQEAIAREKVLKGWKRIKKQELISSMNPHWKDLARKTVVFLNKSIYNETITDVVCDGFVHK